MLPALIAIALCADSSQRPKLVVQDIAAGEGASAYVLTEQWGLFKVTLDAGSP